MIGIGLQSQSANVYCPGKATVITTFEIEGTYTVLFKTDSTTFWVVSDLKNVQLKKGETVERGAFIGEAAWNEDTQNYECDLLLNLKKTNANREKIRVSMLKAPMWIFFDSGCTGYTTNGKLFLLLPHFF